MTIEYHNDTLTIRFVDPDLENGWPEGWGPFPSDEEELEELREALNADIYRDILDSLLERWDEEQ